MRSSKLTVGGSSSISLREDDFASQRLGAIRVEVLTQVRELRETEKMVDSIILRGFLCTSVELVQATFVELCSFLVVYGVGLEGLQKIGSTNLFRAVITDSGQRRNLLLLSVKTQPKFFTHLHTHRSDLSAETGYVEQTTGIPDWR